MKPFAAGIGLAVATGLAGVGGAARAQAPARDIVVTGERVARTPFETASSLVALSGQAIDELAAPDRVEQLLSLAPNVLVGSGAQGPTVRGQDSTGVLQDLPAFLGGTRPRMTLQVDGRAVSFNEFVFGAAPLWDVRRVEIYRSPQTTTQGRNAIAGAVFIATEEPTYAWEGKGRLLGGNEGTWQASAAVSGPLAEGQLAFRLAGDVRNSRPASDIVDRIGGADPDHDDYGQLRFKLLAEPAKIPGLRLSTSYVHMETQMPQVEGVLAPFRRRRDDLPGYGVMDTDVDSLTATLDYAADTALKLSATLSAGDAEITRFAPPGLGETYTRSRDVSVETIVAWHPGERLRLHGGVHYLRARLRQAINLSAVIGQGTFTDRQHSLGLFGEAELRLTPRLALIAGLRRQRDAQDRQGGLGRPALFFPVAFDGRFAAWLPKLSLAWELDKAVRAGVLVQRAYNPGGTALNFDTGDQDDFGAEALWNYELFVRARPGDGRLTLAANLFYNAMSNAQRARSRSYSVPGGGTAFWAEIDNVPAARSYGLEAQIAWRATPRLTLEAGLGLLDTRITRTLRPTDPNRGKAFQRSPSVTTSVALAWRPSDRVALSTQIRHSGAYFSDDINTPAFRIPARTIVDARADYRPGLVSLPVSLFAYARNLMDRFYLTTQTSPMRATVGKPREFGLGAHARF